MDDQLSDEITLKRVVILLTCAVKDSDKFFPQLFLDNNFLVNKQNAMHLKGYKQIINACILQDGGIGLCQKTINKE